MVTTYASCRDRQSLTDTENMTGMTAPTRNDETIFCSVMNLLKIGFEAKELDFMQFIFSFSFYHHLRHHQRYRI